jgi:tetratricopeptide (TPR) repeat protein
MVESALDAVLADVAAAARASAPPVPAMRGSAKHAAAAWLLAQRPWVRALTLAAAALLVLVCGAAAARLVGWMRDEPAAPVQSPATSVHGKGAARVPSAQPALSLAPATQLEPSEPTTFEPRAPRAVPSRSKDAREGALEDLLQQANRARADGEFREAAGLYAQVYDSRPSSLSAYVALVAAGSLELEHLDRPARARKLFEAALSARPKGALDLEARQGLVLALRDLGARADEVAALRKLIALHPTRPAASRARARLVELGE